MKKSIALISAAIVIFAAAGCTNKQQPEQKNTTQDGNSSSAVQESTVEESVAEPSLAESAASTKPRVTKPPTITLYTTRATSPHHLTSRATTTQRTTREIVVPTRRPTTQRTTVLKTTQARTTKPDEVLVTSTAKPVPEPVFDYGGTLSFTAADGLTDSVKIVSHTCEPTDRQTFAIVLTVETLEHLSESNTMYIAYNCYDKDGNRINENALFTVVPLAQPGETVRTVATATLDTAKIVFTNY